MNEYIIVHILNVKKWTAFYTMLFRYFILLLFTFPLSAQQVNIAVNINLLNIINKQKLEPCKENTSYLPLQINEGALELFILCQAFYQAKIDFVPHFIKVPNKRRAIWSVKQGVADVSSDFVRFDGNLKKLLSQNQMSISQPVHNKRALYYAFYTSPNNKKAKQVSSLEKLSQLKAAVPSTWVHQVNLLDKLQMKAEFVQYNNIAKFIDAQRADITLMELKGDKDRMNNRAMSGFPMVVAGKFYSRTTPESEHYVFSNKKPETKELVQAFNRGLLLLAENNLIEKAFEKMYPDLSVLKEWQDITPKPTQAK